MTEELRPCPACGADTIETYSIKGTYQAACWNCHMRGPRKVEKSAAIAAWNSLHITPRITPNDVDCKGCPERRPGLVWTKEPPTVPGWYWYTQSDFSRPRIVQLMYRGLDTDRLTASFAGNEEDEWVEDMVGRWAGPIPMPEEPVS